MIKDKQELIERLAEEEHKSWSHWMQYLFSQCVTNGDGTVTIPSLLVERWTRQMNTSYASLSEREQQSDRNRVNLIMPLIETYRAEKEPMIVCLCGSVRFLHVFQMVAFREALAGKIVLTVECEIVDGVVSDLDTGTRLLFDDLHKHKIELADEVLVLNVKGYIGAHTRSEVEYAERLGKPIRWLEPESEGRYE